MTAAERKTIREWAKARGIHVAASGRVPGPVVDLYRQATRPQSERRHWVFLHECGCPFGLVEQGPTYASEDDAWDAMYDSRAEERQARADGVRTEFVDHATYEREFYPRMTQHCPHGGMS